MKYTGFLIAVKYMYKLRRQADGGMRWKEGEMKPKAWNSGQVGLCNSLAGFLELLFSCWSPMKLFRIRCQGLGRQALLLDSNTNISENVCAPVKHI